MSKVSKEALERFKELHPERFAELQEQAKREWNKPIIRQTVRYVPTATLQPSQLPEWFRRGLTLEQALEEFTAGRKQFMLHTEAHRYFELAYTHEDAIEVACRRHGSISEPIIRIEEMT